MQDKKPYNEKGQAHGYWEIYHSNGNLYYKGNYTNGKRNGYWEGYYEDSQLWHKINYIDDAPYGYWVVYNDNSQLNRIEYHAK